MYYAKMIERLQIKDAVWQQVKAKIAYFRTKFLEVKKWLDKGLIPVQLKVTKKSPFYEELHGIFAAKANITIPYIFDTLQTHDSHAKDLNMEVEEQCFPVQNDAIDKDTNGDEGADANVHEMNLDAYNGFVDLVLPYDDIIDLDTFLPSNICYAHNNDEANFARKQFTRKKCQHTSN